MHLCPQESASSWRKKMDSGSQSRTSEVSGTALGRSALREAQQLLGGARCRPLLACSPGGRGSERRVWRSLCLFLISFCFPSSSERTMS